MKKSNIFYVALGFLIIGILALTMLISYPNSWGKLNPLGPNTDTLHYTVTGDTTGNIQNSIDSLYKGMTVEVDTLADLHINVVPDSMYNNLPSLNPQETNSVTISQSVAKNDSARNEKIKEIIDK